jgi:hypothetical protein
MTLSKTKKLHFKNIFEMKQAKLFKGKRCNDAGASPETSEPAQKTKDSWAHASPKF